MTKVTLIVTEETETTYQVDIDEFINEWEDTIIDYEQNDYNRNNIDDMIEIIRDTVYENGHEIYGIPLDPNSTARTGYSYEVVK